MIIDGRNAEHFGVTPFNVLPEGFTGILGNYPKVAKNVKIIQLVRF